MKSCLKKYKKPTTRKISLCWIRKGNLVHMEKLKSFLGMTEEEIRLEFLVLLNSKKVPIYHFAFASSNATAKKIAADIIGSM